ncbi:MAG: hypothetical protein O7C59_11795 [Rickettsia endosymbiont of Ixodes persulcatus]|nr:hypothetical protein [Rickettsia endosymbiont of Ixodes persulcatus]
MEGYVLKKANLIKFFRLICRDEEACQEALNKLENYQKKHKTEEEQEGEMDILYDFIHDSNKKLKNYNKLKIYYPVCCSKRKTYIVGRKLISYKRTNGKCNKCDAFTCCDYCIGKTVNGHYDVDKICNKIVIAKDNVKSLKNSTSPFDDFLSNYQHNKYYVIDDCLSCS